MKISEKWLRTWVNPPCSSLQLSEMLAMAGLEVEGLQKVAPPFSGVIVAEIISAIPHPNADRLKLCEVLTELDAEPLKIVCGASNARVGIKVALATVGAKLPGDFIIKKSKIRGEESNGMLCSAKELGLAEESNGIMELPLDAPLGQDFRDYWQLDDTLLEISLTPNRGDCLSIQGIAREIAALTGMTLTKPQIETISSKQVDLGSDQHKVASVDLPQVELIFPEACPRYMGKIIKNINTQVKTPLWMQFALERADIRCIHPVVDTTNYVMLELGQPMHAFDLSKITGKIQVRFAQTGEKLTLLNQQEVELNEQTLLIADERNVLAIAGVMGSLDSAVNQNTQDIFLESAYFTQVFVAGTARKYAISSESAYRFERGVDPATQLYALERATELLLAIVGGEASEVIHVQNENYLPSSKKIILTHSKLERYLGQSFSIASIAELFKKLQFEISCEENIWSVVPPSYRQDLKLDVDLIEEVARLVGYQNLPVRLPVLDYQTRLSEEEQHSIQQIKQTLVQLGFNEAITYSFIDPKIHQLFSFSEDVYQLANPIASNMAVMRTSLWPGLLNTVCYNQNRQVERLRLFEIGKVYPVINGELRQINKLAGVITEFTWPLQWSLVKKKPDFYDIKGDLESLFSTMHDLENFKFVPSCHSALHPGQSAEIFFRNRSIGWIGALHPVIQKNLNVQGPIFVFEFEYEVLLMKELSVFRPFSKFPLNRRDIALILDHNITALEITAAIHEMAPDNLVDFLIFDVYQGSQLSENKKSLAIALYLQSLTKTLLDEDIQQDVDKIVAHLKTKFAAELRL